MVAQFVDKAQVCREKCNQRVQIHAVLFAQFLAGNREIIQMFEGTVIAKHGGGISETFTVRRVSYGVGVEKTFPLHSPNVEKIVVFREAKVRRAKLYYLRDRVGKAAKVKEKVR